MGSIRKSSALAAVSALALAVLASGALAQGDMRDRLKLRIPTGLAAEPGHFPRGAPGTSSGSPIAFGAQLHDAFVGVGYQSPVRYSDDADGGMTLGFGVGNATDNLGLEITINALSTIRSGVGNRVGFGAKAHRQFAGNWGVAIGVTNVIANKADDDGNAALYAVVSKVVDLANTPIDMFQALVVSGGVGNEGFRLETDIRDDNSTVGFFGSAALRVHDRLSVIGDWSGQDLSVGVSVVPIASFPLVLTPALSDLTGSAGVHNRTESVRPRFTLGAGLAFRW